jgi:hypothetical protein
MGAYMLKAILFLMGVTFVGLSSPALAGKRGGGGGGGQNATSHAPTSSPKSNQVQTQTKTYKSIGLGMRKSGGSTTTSGHPY